MKTEATENRVHTRSQFYLLNSGGEPVSIYAFRPQDAVDALPALVVDLSDGGVQIISANTMPLVHSDYLLELVLGTGSNGGQRIPVHLVWSRPDGVNTRSGFAFAANPLSAAQIADSLAGSELGIVRCVLYPF